MARKKITYTATRPRPIQYQKQEKLGQDFLVFQIDRPAFSTEIEAFIGYFLFELRRAQINLARAGVGVAKRALIGAVTPWGQARIRGEYYGVPFRPYGKGPGRYNTGNMFSALRLLNSRASQIVYGGRPGKGSTKSDSYVEWGYKASMDRGHKGSPYFEAQERGFLNPMAFDPDRTWATGEAKFMKATSPRRVKGARALLAGMERIASKADEYYSRAWENAKKAFESNGFAASGVGTFVDAKNAYKKPPSFSSGNDNSIRGRLIQMDSTPLSLGGPLTLDQLRNMDQHIESLSPGSTFKI